MQYILFACIEDKNNFVGPNFLPVTYDDNQINT